MSAISVNPFVGLRSFEPDEAMLFFGRDEQTLELLERLHARRFLGVVGSSGCGKSSLVRAGLLSKLQAGLLAAAPDRWQVATMKPGSQPFAELAAALCNSAGLNVPDFAKALRTGGLTPLLEALTPTFARRDTSLLLVVDQFEELFRFGLQSGDEARREEAAEFVALLLGLARQSFPAYVVITLRSDFLGDCDAFLGLPEALNESQYLVPRLTRGNRQEAIEGPARLYGRRIAPRLVDRLLNDGGAAPDQLPVLQHVLLRLWDVAGDAEELDVEHYEAVGGLAKALSKHAREALADLKPAELAVAEKLFRALTTIDANNRQVRRPRTLAQLLEETGVERARLVRVIDVFRGDKRSFLMPPPMAKLRDETLVDISHESLIRQWETLHGWVESEAEAAKVYRRLAEDTERYAARKGSPLTGRALEVARDWRRETQPTDAWAKRYGGGFDAAIAFLAESERRDQSRTILERVVKVTLAALFFLVSVLGVVSVQQWLAARDKTSEANFNLSQMFEEKAGSALKDAQTGDAPQAYTKAWLFNLAALSQSIGERRLPVAMGRLLAPDLRANTFREIWRSPRPLGAIYSVAFSPDGRRLASASEDRTIRVWDVATGQSVATLQGHSAGVWSVAFSPDGRRLASASWDQTIRVWDVATRQSVATLQGHSDAVLSVAFSPDGRRLASASWDQTIRVWDVATGQSVAKLQGHSAAVLSVAFSPDGRRLASASLDRTIRVWDVATGQSVATLQGHSAAVLSVAFSPDGRRLASASEDRTIRVWDVATGQSVATLQGHSAAVRSVSFSPDGRRLASASEDRTIRVWDVATGQSVATLQGHSAGVRSVSFSPDGQRLASASWDQTIRIWDVATRQGVATLQGHSAGVKSVAFSPDGGRLASASWDQTIRVWDVATGQSVALLQGHSAGVLSVSFSPDGRRLASASSDRKIRIWDVATGQSIATLQGHSDAVLSVAFSSDGRRLASASWDQTIRVWDVATGQSVAVLQGHSAKVLSVAFSPNGRRLASASTDGTVGVLDVSTLQIVATLPGHSAEVLSVAFSPDGRRLVSGSSDGTIRLWDVSTLQIVATLQSHSTGVLSVVFSPDGRRLASGSADRMIRLWDLSTGEIVAIFRGHSAAVLSLSFSPDGRRLASGSEDRTVRFWFASFPEALVSPNSREKAFKKIYRASLHVLRYHPNELDFAPDPIDLSPVNDYRFPKSREIPVIDRPRPLDKDVLEWLLEIGKRLPEKPQ